MENKKFEELADDFFKKMRNLIISKGKDYTQGDIDRLKNFKQIGNDLKLTPQHIWYVYTKKHWEAILSYVLGHLESEPIESRCLDLAVYAFLLYALDQDKEKNLPF